MDHVGRDAGAQYEAGQRLSQTRFAADNPAIDTLTMHSCRRSKRPVKMPFGSARVQNGELIQCEADVLRQEMHGFALRATNDVNGRATAAFDAIAANVIPDHPLPGCRTGEEAMLFLEQMTTGIATARIGVHSDSIASSQT